jgi:hypothetical protein
MDVLIESQVKLENLLKTTKSPDKSIYTMQLKMWNKSNKDIQMPNKIVLMIE